MSDSNLNPSQDTGVPRTDLADENIALRRAITEHRTAIRNAGTLRTRLDPGDRMKADAKQAADERLWATLDNPVPTSTQRDE